MVSFLHCIARHHLLPPLRSTSVRESRHHKPEEISQSWRNNTGTGRADIFQPEDQPDPVPLDADCVLLSQ